MTKPKPLVDFSYEDCEFNYDEYYMVQDDIWKAYGAGKGMLCLGCLEANRRGATKMALLSRLAPDPAAPVLHVSGGNQFEGSAWT